MTHLLGFIAIIASLAFSVSPQFRKKVLFEIQKETVIKIDKGLRPMTPLTERLTGRKSPLFEPLSKAETVSSMK